ncbi:branched-chain amino acid ABC transporter permease [Blastococcus tunisiensis]|jgi:branched-subunit amino acid ABC-type transport system permease component|uniref:Branched-chain amino acid ABC-type transport system, permease component n=1 Tax=Blastococcus tunisiensis TaxID=1798228 RepID=A0A1I2BQJ0_9ACTN|nr:branched-chain amino acid ABC transporter permease [Blastococcus sp. DSM 46838]SFE58394.1 Branched-chain amino acid ABC-type transport system, permease component [Blastococcus sp. DSM 46838]
MDTLIIGLIEAAPLVLAAIGFTLIYYLNGFINVAYAETVTSGAYFAILFNSILGLNFYAAIVPAALLAGALSALTYVAVFRPALRRGVGKIEMIVLSVGLSFLMRHAVRLFFGVDLYLFDITDPSYLSVFGTGVTSAQIWAMVLAVLIAVGAYLLTYKTTYGQQIRGLASNADLAATSGIDPTKTSVLVWFVSGVAGGLAGIFIGVFSFVDYTLGWNLILIIIMVTIIGGIGSVRGALVAGAATGIATAVLTNLSDPLYAQVFLLLLFIAVLRFRAAAARSVKTLMARS